MNRLADLALDAAGVAGAGLITFGTWQVYHPAGFIVAGVLMLAGVWLLARRMAD
jgi:hypothetical protein